MDANQQTGKQELSRKVPDRVSDAPIPEDLIVNFQTATWHPEELWVGTWIIEYIRRIARLEAEKQAAHTEGWNAAIEAALDACEDHTDEYADEFFNEGVHRCINSVNVLSKPTPAKPEPSPSSGNRAEGRP